MLGARRAIAMIATPARLSKITRMRAARLVLSITASLCRFGKIGPILGGPISQRPARIRDFGIDRLSAGWLTREMAKSWLQPIRNTTSSRACLRALRNSIRTPGAMPLPAPSGVLCARPKRYRPDSRRFSGAIQRRCRGGNGQLDSGATRL